jgi:class 3 adenylate cyclase
MKTLSELQTSIDEVLQGKWKKREGHSIPEPEDIQLGNDAITLEGTVLYADMADSTGLVQGYKNWFAAEIYKLYLLCASELIRNNGGSITAFDGDRVMGVFIGGSKNSSAAKCALQINHMVSQEINPRVRKRYPDTSYVVQHAIGIDTSSLFVARTGAWGANDLVWVGRAANYAAKLCSLRGKSGATFITAEVFDKLSSDSKFGGNPKENMWTKTTWDEMGITIYRSSWRWAPK